MKKNILYVEQTSDGTVGGSHYCMLYLIQLLNRELYEPIALFHETNSLHHIFQKECQAEVINIPQFFRSQPNYIRKLLNSIINLLSILKCYLFIKRKKVKLVHLNNSVSGGYYNWLISSLLARVPCITHERNFTIYPKSSFFRLMVKRYKRIVPVSNVIGQNIISQGIHPGLVETVYDGIDPDFYRTKVKRLPESVRTEFNIGPDTIIIGLIGNIREWKGQNLLLDALNIVQKQSPDFFCLLVGDTSKNTLKDENYANLLSTKISQYGLEEKVVLTGYRDDVADLVNALDIQINASIKPDPFPHVILEGMSLGKAIIATNLGGAVESIENGISGFLVPPEYQALAQKILLLINEKTMRERLSENAASRVQDFSMSETINRLEKIYQQLLS